jgi:hypothetical protein
VFITFNGAGFKEGGEREKFYFVLGPANDAVIPALRVLLK